MNNRVFIQTQGRHFLSEHCHIAHTWFKKMGDEIIEFSVEDLQREGEFRNLATRNDIFIGGINSLRKVIRILEVNEPKIQNPHTYLRKFCGSREIIETKLKQVRDYIKTSDIPIFIKPLVDDKLFTGFVVKNEIDLLTVKSLSNDIDVLMSEVIDIRSEYRCFVHKRNLVGAKNYTGDFRVIPDFFIVEQAIQEYKEQPIAYTLDFAITKEGETVLIEINDAFGLSSYGFNPMVYCQMLQDRWLEIMRNN